MFLPRCVGIILTMFKADGIHIVVKHFVLPLAYLNIRMYMLAFQCGCQVLNAQHHLPPESPHFEGIFNSIPNFSGLLAPFQTTDVGPAPLLSRLPTARIVTGVTLLVDNSLGMHFEENPRREFHPALREPSWNIPCRHRPNAESR